VALSTEACLPTKPTCLPATSAFAELREMRQTADREKKEEADLTATMGKVDKEVGGQGIRLGCPVCCTSTVAKEAGAATGLGA
jgi:hypothetical protein